MYLVKNPSRLGSITCPIKVAKVIDFKFFSFSGWSFIAASIFGVILTFVELELIKNAKNFNSFDRKSLRKSLIIRPENLPVNSKRDGMPLFDQINILVIKILETDEIPSGRQAYL